MPVFKEFLEKDLETFLNLNEFGDLHTLDSKKIMMVIEEDSQDSKKGLSNEYEDASQGIFESTIIIYVKAVDYKKPSVGKKVTLDTKTFYVVESSNSDGLLKIELSANES